MKKNVFILFVVLLTTSVFMSCSSDDNNDNGKVENTIIINGKEYLNDESASVSYNSYSQSISFEAGFSNPESLMDISYFTIASNDAASVDKLTNGMELNAKVLGHGYKLPRGVENSQDVSDFEDELFHTYIKLQSTKVDEPATDEKIDIYKLCENSFELFSNRAIDKKIDLVFKNISTFIKKTTDDIFEHQIKHEISQSIDKLIKEIENYRCEMMDVVKKKLADTFDNKKAIVSAKEYQEISIRLSERIEKSDSFLREIK